MDKRVRHICDLTEREFIEHPVWTWAQSSDESLVEPVQHLDPLPECHDALFIAARFTLGNGKFLNGSVAVRCSDQQVYLVEVIVGRHHIDLPLQSQKRFSDALRKLSEYVRVPSDQITPIIYETDYAFAGQSNVSGIVLDASEAE